MKPTRLRAAAAAVAVVLALGLLTACSDEDGDCTTDALALTAAERPRPPAPRAPKAPKAKPAKPHGGGVHVDLDDDCDD
jgi:hypothetical protein